MKNKRKIIISCLCIFTAVAIFISFIVLSLLKAFHRYSDSGSTSYAMAEEVSTVAEEEQTIAEMDSIPFDLVKLMNVNKIPFPLTRFSFIPQFNTYSSPKFAFPLTATGSAYEAIYGCFYNPYTEEVLTQYGMSDDPNSSSSPFYPVIYFSQTVSVRPVISLLLRLTPNATDYTPIIRFSLTIPTDDNGMYYIQRVPLGNEYDNYFFIGLLPSVLNSRTNLIYSYIDSSNFIIRSNQVYNLTQQLNLSPDDYQNGYDKGKQEGYDSGYDIGKQEGYTSGYGIGFSEGQGRGYAQGKADGILIGTEQGKEEGYNSGYQNGYNKGLSASVANPVSYFLTPVHDFLDTKLFGTFSLGSAFAVVLYVAIAVIFIKMFAGG